jgi:hypothetical protein
MKHIISSTALVMALSLTPALAAANSFGGQGNAHDRCKRDEDTKQVLGGLAGAVVGGVLGSQVSGNGARTEGSAIGAVLGGLAGAGIADKAIDCDPVYDTNSYQTSGGSYPASTYPASTYPASTYPSGSYQTGSYQTGSYPSGSYPVASTSYGSSTQPYYEDRVTVSNHPVYSDPTYGAGGISQGTTYSSGTVSYPPSGDNTQYASRTYSTVPSYTTSTSYETAPSYETLPTYNSAQRARVLATSTAPVYSQARTIVQPAVHSPVAQRTVYSGGRHPHFRAGQYLSRESVHRGGLHRHGRFECDMVH